VTVYAVRFVPYKYSYLLTYLLTYLLVVDREDAETTVQVFHSSKFSDFLRELWGNTIKMRETWKTDQ